MWKCAELERRTSAPRSNSIILTSDLYLDVEHAQFTTYTMQAASNLVGAIWNKKEEPPFPPPEWGLDASGRPDTETATAARVPLPPTPAVEHDGATDLPFTSGDVAANEDPDPAPATLARRIRDLLPSYPADGKAAPVPPLAAPVNADASLAEPPTPAEVESGLARLLRTPSVMNGSLEAGKRSVWDALERLRAPRASGSAQKSKAQGVPTQDSTAEQSDDDDDDDDDSSVMLYAPLVPDNNSRVELAEREIVRTDANGHVVRVVKTEPAQPESSIAQDSKGADLSRRQSWWPFNKNHAKDEKQPATSPTTQGTEPPPEVTLSEPTSVTKSLIGSLKRRVSQKQRERTLWVPSPDQLSFQASWWGYRL
jgi:hypothetical protein